MVGIVARQQLTALGAMHGCTSDMPDTLNFWEGAGGGRAIHYINITFVKHKCKERTVGAMSSPSDAATWLMQ